MKTEAMSRLRISTLQVSEITWLRRAVSAVLRRSGQGLAHCSVSISHLDARVARRQVRLSDGVSTLGFHATEGGIDSERLLHNAVIVLQRCE
jgi:hypothetical protein